MVSTSLAPSAVDVAGTVTMCLPGWVVDAPVKDPLYGVWRWSDGDRLVTLTTWPALVKGNFDLTFRRGGAAEAYLVLSSLKQIGPWLHEVLGL